MAYTTRLNSEITDFWPDDTATVLYFSDHRRMTLQDMIDKAKEKWPEATFDQIEISAEHIHTHCVYYDRYDSGDYTNFTVMTYNKG